MEIERSCGAVVFTKENKDYRFVIIQSLEGTYGFPKGHMKDYETERQTAMREVREETGLDVTILPDFRELVEYIIPVNGHLKTAEKQLSLLRNTLFIPWILTEFQFVYDQLWS